MKTVAVIQCVAGDIGVSTDPDDYCISACKQASFFDGVVMACPDHKASDNLEGLAEKWGIAVYRGSEFNIAERILGGARKSGATMIVRVLMRQFYLDIQLVGRMIDALREADGDYVVLPSDFNYALAADVSSIDAIARVCQEIDKIPEGFERASLMASPWNCMEASPAEFRLVPISDIAPYPAEKSLAIREKLRRIHSENQTHFEWNFPASSYNFISSQIAARGQSVGKILDIACGKGQGTRRLADTCRQVFGVDFDPENVAEAERSFGDLETVSFGLGDATTYSRPGTFDVVVSLHTLEHLAKPEEFLERTRENLVLRGTLFLEVPLLLPKPMGMPLFPFHDKEYYPDELVALTKQMGFTIVNAWGKNRHSFVPYDWKVKDDPSTRRRLTALLLEARISE